MALARRQIAPWWGVECTDWNVHYCRKSSRRSAEGRKNRLCTIYIHIYIRHFVSLSVRSTALGTNRRDKFTRVDFSLERRVASKMISRDSRRLLLWFANLREETEKSYHLTHFKKYENYIIYSPFAYALLLICKIWPSF